MQAQEKSTGSQFVLEPLLSCIGTNRTLAMDLYTQASDLGDTGTAPHPFRPYLFFPSLPEASAVLSGFCVLIRISANSACRVMSPHECETSTREHPSPDKQCYGVDGWVAEATFHLARAYQMGAVVPRNATRARELYKLAIREAPSFRYAAAPWLVPPPPPRLGGMLFPWTFWNPW